MLGFLVVIAITIAIMKHHHWHMSHGGWRTGRKYYRFRDVGEKYAEKLKEDIQAAAHSGIRDFSDKYAEKHKAKFDKHAAEFEKKAGLAPVEEEEKKYSTYEERVAYRKARKQASKEAGFYAHLMAYATTIGFLFLINLLTTSYPWFLWPALGWGFGLMSHFMGVYGWRYVRTRVFDPAIQREVQREVLHEKEVLHTEKQASLDELTATFAHEIRNPIAAAKSLVQQMGEDPTSHENVEYAKVALDELARVERSVSHLLKYAKEEDYNFDNVNVATVLDSALTQLRNKLESNQITVSRNYLSGPMIRADADKLRQVFSNIIDNAIDAMSALQTERRLELGIRSDKGSGAAVVDLKDNGCGIPDDKLAKIFNPFYTSKSNGTGLGMAVARKVVEAHRGNIQIDSQVGSGTRFEITLPLSDAVRAEPSQQEPRASSEASQTTTAGPAQTAPMAALKL